MASVNKITLIGHVGGDPELRFTPNGKAVTSFSLATNHSYTGADGEKVEETTWFRITCWDKLAELVNQYVSKGDQIYVEGRVKLNEWEGEDGTKRASLEVTAGQVIFLGNKKEAKEEAGLVPGGEPEEEDSVPF